MRQTAMSSPGHLFRGILVVGSQKSCQKTDTFSAEIKRNTMEQLESLNSEWWLRKNGNISTEIHFNYVQIMIRI